MDGRTYGGMDQHRDERAGQTNGGTEGQTKRLIETRGRIKKHATSAVVQPVGLQ